MKFHLDAVSQHVPGFDPVDMFVFIQQLDSSGKFAGFEYKVGVNAGDGLASEYPNCVSIDLVRHCGLLLPGSAIFNSDIMALEKWIDSEYYHALKKKALGLHQAATVIYGIPFQREQKFTIGHLEKPPQSDRFVIHWFGDLREAVNAGTGRVLGR